jgi:F0F1-type ATP synthase membrane subunit b/b'
MATRHNTHFRSVVIPLLSLLILTTGIVPLAAASITLLPSKTSYNPGDNLTVIGTATPNSAVTIGVYNPSTKLVGIAQGNSDATGQYSITVFQWPAIPTLDLPFGLYTVKATDAATGNIAEAAVEFTQSTTQQPTNGIVPGELVQISVTSGTYQLGDTARVFVMFTYNGSKVNPSSNVAVIYTPSMSAAPVVLRKVSNGLYYGIYTPATAGTYAVEVEASARGTTNTGIGSFVVSDSLATETGLNDLQNELTAKLDTSQQAIVDRIESAESIITSSISAAVSSLNTAITNAQNDVKTSVSNIKSDLDNAISSSKNDLNNAITSAKNDLNNKIDSAQSDVKSSVTSSENSVKSQVTSTENAIKSALSSTQSAISSAISGQVQPLSSDMNQVTDAVASMEENLESTNEGVAAASTWIMVVGIIAAITLVLELVALVRKLS